MTTFIDRAEITEKLNSQFSEILRNIKTSKLTWQDAKNLVMNEEDLLDSGLVEPNSANWEFARDMQNDFLRGANCE